MRRMDVASCLARVDRKSLHPIFVAKVLAVLETLLARGQRFVATSGYRTFAEQERLYQKGRRNVPGEHTVTNAHAGYSAHNWGIALDFAHDIDPNTPGLEPDWKESNLRILADEAKKVGGLDEGLYWSSFTDGPHIGLALPAGVGWKQLLQVAPDGNLSKAWQYLDGKLGHLNS
jgi:hypothetical protein